MRRKPPPELDFRGATLTSLAGRPSLVDARAFGRPHAAGGAFADFADSLPEILGARDLRSAARAVARARGAGRPVMLAMGGHPVKVGLGPVIASAMADGFVTSVSANGSVLVHDFEIAVSGATSEDVSRELSGGRFGVTSETGAFVCRAAREAALSGEGLGRACARILDSMDPPRRELSVMAAAFGLGVPLTIHPAVGTDVFAIHPDFDAGDLGRAADADFRLFCRLVAELEGGVFINLGSAVIMPEVFLKAVSLARNLGFRQDGLFTVNMDFIQQYRPRVNVVERPTRDRGAGVSLTGHHEIMFPLLMAMAREFAARGETDGDVPA
ncbi:MAG: hypothetical protein LBT40_01885 [Deltaproteobacteria bacterium]|nr:hypothetical protein [Deltaproteobacteria bacterium]